MDAVLLLIVTVATTECACHLPWKRMSARFLEIFPRALRTIRHKVASDHWRERALLKLAKLSLMSSICAGSSIFGLVALFLAGLYLLSLLSPPLWEFGMSLRGIAMTSVFAILYLVGRIYAESRLQRN
jgi:hypothetical protein